MSTGKLQSEEQMARVTIAIRQDDHGIFAWIETRIPGGWAVNRRAAVAALRRCRPGATDLTIADEWHVPFRHRAFKIYFDMGLGDLGSHDLQLGRTKRDD
jgi:hypothetical protein